MYHFFIKISDDFLNDVKPFALIFGLETILFLDLLTWFCYFLNTRLILRKLEFIAIFGTLGAINIYIFLFKNKWKQYSHEFEKYSKNKRILWNSIILVIIIIAFFLIFFSIWMLNKVGYIPEYHPQNSNDYDFKN